MSLPGQYEIDDGARVGGLRDTILLVLPGPRLALVGIRRTDPDGLTLAQAVLRHGAGGLDIDGCRVGTSPADAAAMNRCNSPKSGQTREHDNGFGGGWSGGKPLDTSAGRWPPNVLLVHDRECSRMGSTKVRTGTAVCRNTAGTEKNRHGVYGSMGRQASDQSHAGPDGLETVPAWDCQPGCPVGLLDRQAGPRTSGLLQPHHTRHTSKGWSGPFQDDFDGPAARGTHGGDSGTASRFFPQLDSPDDAMAWIRRLLGNPV